MHNTYKNIAAACMVVVGVLFIIYGAFRGEMFTALQKAVQICLECIGIG